MKVKWKIVCVLLFGLSICTNRAEATILERPSLFIEVLKQNDNLAQTTAALMQVYLEDPTPRNVAEFKKMIRQAIGDQERLYFSQNGVSVNDFVGGIDAISKMPVEDRTKLMTMIESKSYEDSYRLMRQYDAFLVIGKEVIPLSDGKGKILPPTNAKIDFEKQLRKVNAENSGQSTPKSTSNAILDSIEVHWSDNAVQWLMTQGNLAEDACKGKNPEDFIGLKEFDALLNLCLNPQETMKSESSEEIHMTRIEGFARLNAYLKNSGIELVQELKEPSAVGWDLEEPQRLEVQTLVNAGVVKGFSDGSIRPNQILRYGEVWAVLKNIKAQRK